MDDTLIYYFKCSRPLTKEEIIDAVSNIANPPRYPLPRLVHTELPRECWTVATFREGASLDHNGISFILSDAITKVNLSVAVAESHVYTSIKEAPVDTILKQLATLPNEEIAALQKEIKNMLHEGVIGISERAALHQYLKEKFSSLGNIFLLEALPCLTIESLNYLVQCSTHKKIASVSAIVTTLITVGMSISNIASSIQSVIDTKAQFQSEVLLFLAPIMELLKQLKSYTLDTANLLLAYIKNPSVARLNSILAVSGYAVNTMKKMVDKINVVEDKIVKFGQKAKKEFEEARKNAILSLLLAIPASIQLADGLKKLASGKEALSVFDKIELATEGTRVAFYAAEFCITAFSAYTCRDYLKKAKELLAYYDKIKQNLHQEEFEKLYQSLYDALHGENNLALLDDLQKKYASQGEALKLILEQGEELKEKSKNTRKK